MFGALAACGGDNGGVCEVAPTVSAVEPIELCETGGTITVTGTGFAQDSVIFVSGVEITTTFVSETQLTGSVEAGMALEPHDVAVSNGAECQSEPLADAFASVARPDVFFVDPPTIYGEVDMWVTVYASGVRNNTPTVLFRPTGGSETFELENPEFDGNNRIFGTVTAPMNLAEGEYDVIVSDDGCLGELARATTVTDTLTVHVSDIDPAFGVSSIDPEQMAIANTGATRATSILPPPRSASTRPVARSRWTLRPPRRSTPPGTSPV